MLIHQHDAGQRFPDEALFWMAPGILNDYGTNLINPLASRTYML